MGVAGLVNNGSAKASDSLPVGPACRAGLRLSNWQAAGGPARQAASGPAGKRSSVPLGKRDLLVAGEKRGRWAQPPEDRAAIGRAVHRSGFRRPWVDGGGRCRWTRYRCLKPFATRCKRPPCRPAAVPTATSGGSRRRGPRAPTTCPRPRRPISPPRRSTAAQDSALVARHGDPFPCQFGRNLHLAIRFRAVHRQSSWAHGSLIGKVGWDKLAEASPGPSVTPAIGGRRPPKRPCPTLPSKRDTRGRRFAPVPPRRRCLVDWPDRSMRPVAAARLGCTANDASGECLRRNYICNSHLEYKSRCARRKMSGRSEPPADIWDPPSRRRKFFVRAPGVGTYNAVKGLPRSL